MIKEKINNLMYDTNQLLREREYINSSILYVLENTKDIQESIIGVCDKDYEIYEVILKNKEINHCYDWDYNVDEYIFEKIEKEFNIEFMTMEFHKAIWESIEKLDLSEVEYKIGLQKYLKYCKENNIDKSTIEKETKSEDIFDIMKYYNEKTNYITIEDGQVKMSTQKYQEESEISYISFVLGYDLLNEMITNSNMPECDVNYDFCNYLAKKFIKTDEYKNEWKSTYDVLKEWVEDNKDIIKSEYLFFTEQDNKVIVEVGKRNNEPVALVEHNFKDGTKEYIIAFNYEVTNEKLNWGYGYYYSDNLDKAKEDFEKVKAGGNLADTFDMDSSDNLEKSKIKKHKERER